MGSSTQNQSYKVSSGDSLPSPLQAQVEEILQRGFSSADRLSRTLPDPISSDGVPLGATLARHYRNPYQESVIDSGVERLRRERDLRQRQLEDRSIASGGHRGNRFGLAASESDRAYFDSLRDFLAATNHQGFNTSQSLGRQAAGDVYSQLLTREQAPIQLLANLASSLPRSTNRVASSDASVVNNPSALEHLSSLIGLGAKVGSIFE